MLLYYRIVKGAELRREHFLSDRASGKPKPIDPEKIEWWEGFSVYDSEDRARQTARTYPAIGDYLAVLGIEERSAIIVKRTGRRHRGHYTMYGDPDVILATVQRIIAV